MKINDCYTSSGICKNGFAICSILSEGHIRTTVVPRHTTKPRFLVWSVNLNGSSGSNNKESMSIS